jgi:hypothetical protein
MHDLTEGCANPDRWLSNHTSIVYHLFTQNKWHEYICNFSTHHIKTKISSYVQGRHLSFPFHCIHTILYHVKLCLVVPLASMALFLCPSLKYSSAPKVYGDSHVFGTLGCEFKNSFVSIQQQSFSNQKHKKSRGRNLSRNQVVSGCTDISIECTRVA